MIPGPEKIIACPHCQALAKYQSLTSGNTFGARVWTDGKKVAPMLPLPPSVVKCHCCAKCYWLANASEVGAFSRWDDDAEVDPAWKAAPVVQEPSEADYHEALQGGLATTLEEEQTLRILARWQANDAFRDAGKTAPGGAADAAHASEPGRRNLEALVALIGDVDDDDLIMKAEALRELGEFASATEILDRVTTAKLASVVEQFRALCDARETGVRELQFGR